MLKMNFVLMPSLEHIALVKVAVTLWNEKNIRDQFSKENPVTASGIPILGNHKSKEWQQIEDSVVEKVSLLPQPDALKSKILKFIHPIGFQILKWIEYHTENPHFDTNVPNEFFWTPRGTIDKKKTAEVCVKDERVNIYRRYNLACNYCLEKDIVELWNKMPEDRRKSFYDGGTPTTFSQEILVVCCTYDMKGEMARLERSIENRLKRKCPPYQFALEYAAEKGNKAAVEYFLQKLNPDEKEDCLVRAAGIVSKNRFRSRCQHTYFPKDEYIDALCFLLLQMDEHPQSEVYKNDFFQVLGCFLDWPWQSSFLGIAHRTWNFLSELDHYHVLRAIIHKVMSGYKDYNYQQLFQDFWEQSPNAYKKYCIHTCTSDPTLLLELLKIKDKQNIRIVLESATDKEKEDIILGDERMDICAHLLYSNELDLLKFFIQECISSKEGLIDLKESFSNYISMKTFFQKKSEEDKQMLDIFVSLINDLIQ